MTLIVGGGLLAYSKLRDNDPPASTEVINYAPASPVEKQEAEDNKDKIVKEQEQAKNQTTPTTSSGKKAVVPTITNTSGSINAYVTGIFEEGGTCTASFTKDGAKLIKTSEGFQNVSYTQCAPMNLEDGFLSPGTWSVMVSYSSAKSEGASEAQKIEVN